MAGPRVVVVGAGPAGARAAEALVEAGLRPIVVDESARSGGQIYRRQPEGFLRPAQKLYGSEAAKAQALHARFDALRDAVEYRPDTLAWNVADNALHVVRGTTAEAIAFDALIIAAGATDRLMPLPGWTLPGVYSLGAAQIALKAQACAIGSRIVFLGSGPLLYLVAHQYVEAGASVAAVLDTATFGNGIAALPGLLARPELVLRGLGYRRDLRRAGVRLLGGVSPRRIEGDAERGPTGVTFEHRAMPETIDCDAVGIGWHLRAESQLADLARCDFAFDPVARQWLPRLDPDGRSSVKGVYLAGDGARLQGADAAEASGRLAALAALSDLGRRGHEPAMAELRMRLQRFERFRHGLATAFPWPHDEAAALPDDTLVCRCEAITAGELRHAVRGRGAPEVNRAKAFSRVGMGRCQGRYCGLAAAEIVAAASGAPVEAVGRLRGQAPVKPLPVATEFVS
ncbi:MAG: FAD-dependent oxidoreductase [Alphaproteobacteria bacterium]|nr:FAD-dependent oxidoreductase [Alphaproteobacteria bacterium]